MAGGGATPAAGCRTRGDDAARREPAAQQGTHAVDVAARPGDDSGAVRLVGAGDTRQVHAPQAKQFVEGGRNVFAACKHLEPELRAAPQVSSSDSASPCQCSHAPTACGWPSAPASVKARLSRRRVAEHAPAAAAAGRLPATAR